MVRLLLPSAATCVVEVIDTETQRCRDTERCREKGRPFHSDWALQICLSRMVKCHLHTEVGNLSALALKWILMSKTYGTSSPPPSPCPARSDLA